MSGYPVSLHAILFLSLMNFSYARLSSVLPTGKYYFRKYFQHKGNLDLGYYLKLRKFYFAIQYFHSLF